MSARVVGVAVGFLAAGVVGACGEETAIIVATDLRAFQVPEEVDALYLELSDADGALIGRSFPLAAGQADFSIELLRGDRLPETFTLVLYAFLADVRVARSPPRQVSFAADETQKLTLVLTRL
jgi:hypothetical protein